MAFDFHCQSNWMDCLSTLAHIRAVALTGWRLHALMGSWVRPSVTDLTQVWVTSSVAHPSFLAQVLLGKFCIHFLYFDSLVQDTLMKVMVRVFSITSLEVNRFGPSIRKERSHGLLHRVAEMISTVCLTGTVVLLDLNTKFGGRMQTSKFRKDIPEGSACVWWYKKYRVQQSVDWTGSCWPFVNIHSFICLKLACVQTILPN